jgi:hypothetical protein
MSLGVKSRTCPRSGVPCDCIIDLKTELVTCQLDSVVRSIDPDMTLEQAQERVATKTAPRVTKESIEERIERVSYTVMDDIMTVCVITMRNGFKALGSAVPADPRNYDADVGKRYAFEDAFKGLWRVEGYLLCERLRGDRLSMQHPAHTTRQERGQDAEAVAVVKARKRR